jgi:Ca-activated chloride channel family protein
MKRIPLLCIAALAAITLSCGAFGPSISIISGSENRTLEPLLEEFTLQTGIKVEMHYKGSLDIMLMLEEGNLEYDAVWPANSIWLHMGDKNRRVKHAKSIMNSPVIFGVRQSLARELGYLDQEVMIADILDDIAAKRLRFMMTSATQSNSGASAYMGFLSALSQREGAYNREDLYTDRVKEGITQILSGINRSSGSSGWLMDLFLESDYDAMVNYEALLIETNNELQRQGKELLHFVYPLDGMVLADSPLGFVDQGRGKEEDFLALQEYLLSSETSQEILNLGRRTGFTSLGSDLPEEVFKPSWGISSDRILNTIPLPSAEVIRESLFLYQTGYKKPSFTIFVLDYSGSMQGDREKDMKIAMSDLLDQNKAARLFLQTGQEDVTVVIPFSTRPMDQWQVVGNDQRDLSQLSSRISNLNANGNTDIYTPVVQGIRYYSQYPDKEKYIPAVVLLTDGASNLGSFSTVIRSLEELDLDIPIFSIQFENADKSQLEELAQYSRARIFDGRSNLADAFRKVKGYN